VLRHALWWHCGMHCGGTVAWLLVAPGCMLAGSAEEPGFQGNDMQCCSRQTLITTNTEISMQHRSSSSSSSSSRHPGRVPHLDQHTTASGVAVSQVQAQGLVDVDLRRSVSCDVV
jgi:hypothetical protein